MFDDDEDILHMTRLILAQEYEQVIAFSSCRNLIEDIERIRLDLILLDIRIPGLHGEESLLLLHASEKTKNIPVILFSAVTDIERIAKRTKAIAIIEKPFDIQTLRETVRKYI